MVNADKHKHAPGRALSVLLPHLHQPRRHSVPILALIAAVLPGCTVPAAAWKGKVEWPDEHSAQLAAQPMEAGAALAAAAAIRELVGQNTSPRLFRGCSSPEQGLDVAVFKGPTPGLYYVVLDQRFDRCGGPSGRVLDWWHVYAVTPQGEVVAQAPPPAAEEPMDSPPRPSPAAPAPPPAPEAPPPPAPEAPPPPAPEAPPPAEPSSASTPPVPPVPGTPAPTSVSPEGP